MTLSRREKRLVAAGLLLLAVALLWLVLVQPILSGFADRAQQREDLAGTHATNAAVIARTAIWRRQATALRADRVRYAMVAPDAERAGAALKDRVVLTLRRNGVVTKILQDIPAPPGWARIRIDVATELQPLTAALRDLQNDRPTLVIESLTVSADRAFETGRLSSMDVRLEIAAPFQPLASR